MNYLSATPRLHQFQNEFNINSLEISCTLFSNPIRNHSIRLDFIHISHIYTQTSNCVWQFPATIANLYSLPRVPSPWDFDKLSACNTRLKSLQTLPSFDGVSSFLFLFFTFFVVPAANSFFHTTCNFVATTPTMRLFTLSRRFRLALMYSLPLPAAFA